MGVESVTIVITRRAGSSGQQQRVVGRPCDVTDVAADQEKGHGTPYIILK